MASFDDLLEHYGKPIAPFLADPEVTELCVNGAKEFYVERRGLLQRVEGEFIDDDTLETFIRQIGHWLGQELSDNHPILDARLPDNARINGVLRPVSINSPTLTIRPAPRIFYKLDDLISFGAVSKKVAAFLGELVVARKNIIISGGTGSGKTTFLRACTGFLGPCERLVVIEDTTEHIAPHAVHVCQFECPRGKGLTIGALIHNAMRQRPDRIIIGEIRSAEAAAAFLEALNTGHQGTISTTHANSAEAAYVRLALLNSMAMPQISFPTLTKMVEDNIDWVVQIGRVRQGDNYVRRLLEVGGFSNGSYQCRFRYCSDSDDWLSGD